MSAEQVNAFSTVSRIITRRKTTKVLASPDNPVVLDPPASEHVRTAVNESVRIAGMAPFHHDRKLDGLAEPWRVTLLWADDCRQLAAELPNLVQLPPNNRLRGLLSGCAAAVIVTWLPEVSMADSTKQQHVNDEHLAATGAYVQNLLLLLESQDLESYWASGGLLASPSVQDRLSIPTRERILAVVYVSVPGIVSAEAERLSGKNRENRSAPAKWIREIGQRH